MRYLLFFIGIMFISCEHKGFDKTYLIKTAWQYDSGFHIGGDFIFFDTTKKVFELKRDTIFYKGVASALVIRIDKSDYNLIISSLNRKDVGIYRDENESLAPMK